MEIIGWSRSEKDKILKLGVKRISKTYERKRETDRQREKTKQNGWKGELSSPHRSAQALRWEDKEKGRRKDKKKQWKRKRVVPITENRGNNKVDWGLGVRKS
jgi:DNA gyrase/topoisomerase IV subunit A